MTPSPLLLRPLAADAFEELVESAIIRAEDLYELDGDSVLRRRDGRIETTDIASF